MKILLRVLGTIIGVIAIGACLLGAIRNMSDAEDANSPEFAAAKEQLKTMQSTLSELGGDENSELAKSMKELESMPSSGTFTLVGVLNGILAALSIVLIVFLYLSKPKPTMILAVLVVILSVVMIIEAPVVLETWTSGVSNKKLAIIAAVPVIATALLAVLASRTKKKVTIA